MIATSAPLRRRESDATMRSGPCGSTTASSSITVPRWRRPGVPIICPVLSITSTGRALRSIAVTIDAHASTARSNDAWSCAPGRTSSSTSTGVRRRASFWRIIRWPRRAVDRQCTWRRSSPGAYSRSVWNSPLGSIRDCTRGLLAVEVEPARLRRRAHVADARVHDHLFGPEHDARAFDRARTGR